MDILQFALIKELFHFILTQGLHTGKGFHIGILSQVTTQYSFITIYSLKTRQLKLSLKPGEFVSTYPEINK